MSFIYNDKNFMNLVVNFNKKAQDASTTSDEKVKTIQNILDKVFERLKGTNLNAVKFQKIDKFISDLAPTNMVNLDGFLFYLSKEKSEYQGKLIVTKEMQGYQGTSPPGYVFYKNEYRVNVIGLKGTLDYLKKSETYQKNSLFKTMLDALYASAESEIKGFKDASSSLEIEPVFDFKQEINLDQRIESNRGTIQLTTQNLSDPNSLVKWLSDNRIRIKEKGKDITNDRNVLCNFAIYLYEQVTEEKFKSVCRGLIDKIPGCTISGASGTSGAAGGALGGTTITDANKKEAKDTLIAILNQDGPMYINQIKFNVIIKFLDSLAILFPNRDINSDKDVFEGFSKLLNSSLLNSGDPQSINPVFDASNATIINPTNNLAQDNKNKRTNVQAVALINELKISVQNMTGHINEAVTALYAANPTAARLKLSSQVNSIESNTRELDAMSRRVMSPRR